MAYCLFDVPVVGGCKIGQTGCNHGVLSLKVQQDGYNLQERLQPCSLFFLSCVPVTGMLDVRWKKGCYEIGWLY